MVSESTFNVLYVYLFPYVTIKNLFDDYNYWWLMGNTFSPSVFDRSTSVNGKSTVIDIKFQTKWQWIKLKNINSDQFFLWYLTMGGFFSRFSDISTFINGKISDVYTKVWRQCQWLMVGNLYSDQNGFHNINRCFC